MSYTYINRKGNVFHLHQGKTKTGKPKYYFSKSDKGNTIDSIPDGYEMYENPNAQVFLIKDKPKLISDGDVKIVNESIRNYSKLTHFIVDRKDDKITIHTPGNDLSDLDSIVSLAGAMRNIDVDKYKEQMITYLPMMRFVLSDVEKRLFYAERFCFKGSIDDWIPIGSENYLEMLCMSYLKHLGQESFYDLIL